MGSINTPQILRKLGHSELFSSSRHNLGIYRCVTVSCRYSHPPSSRPDGNTSISPHFFAALATVIKDQPMLRVGITGDDTHDAHFIHIPSIDLRSQVSVIAVPCQSVQEYEDKVAEHQGWEHDQMFQDLAVRPPWRITILRPSSDNAHVMEQFKGQEDVFFAFHHSLMDGTSGRRFHEMLLATPAYQGQQVPAEPEQVLSFPEPPSSLPETQEKVVNFTLSIGYTVRTLWTALGPSFLQPPKQPIWNAIPVDLSLPYKTRVKPVDISPEVLTTLLSACREHSVTITALLHSLVLASLSSRIPSPTEAPAFAASTPISLRPFTSPSMNPAYVTSLRCLVATTTHHFSPKAVSALRAPNADTTALIWQNARQVKDELTAKLNSLPKDDIMAMFKFVGDWFSFWRDRDGRQRTESWEISNIGVLKNPEAQADVPRATRMLFTNGAMAAGPPVSVNVASVAGSKLTIGLSWHDAVLKEDVMDQLAEDLSSYAAKFYETGKAFV
ncbi:alcohol acetyltransferase [Trichoderma compactum]